MSVSKAPSMTPSQLATGWVTAWQCTDADKRVKYLTLLAEKGSLAAIATLHTSIGKISLPKEAMIREKYEIWKKRLDETLFSHMEDVGRVFCAGTPYWRRSLLPSFWESAQKAQQVYFSQMLGLVKASPPKTPPSFEDALLQLQQRGDDDLFLFRFGIKALHGHRPSLLEWSIPLIGSALQSYTPSGASSAMHRKQLEEGETLLFSLLEDECDLSAHNVACIGVIQHLISLRSFEIRMSVDTDPSRESQILKKSRTYLALHNRKGPCHLSSMDRIVLLSRILHLSTDREEQLRSAAELASLCTTLSSTEIKMHQPYGLLCYEILRTKDHALDLFVASLGETRWLFILKQVLHDFSTMTSDQKTVQGTPFTIILVLETFILFHTSRDQPIPADIHASLEKSLSDSNLISLDLFMALNALKGSDLAKFFLPYAYHYAQHDPFAWVFFANALQNFPSLLPKYHPEMVALEEEPIVSLALFLLYDQQKTFPPEAEKWAKVLSSRVQTLRPQNDREEAHLWAMLHQLYAYHTRTEGAETSARAILHQICETFPQRINEELQIHMIVHELVQCSGQDEVVLHLQKLESLLTAIDPNSSTYLYTCTLLIAADSLSTQDPTLPFTYHLPNDYFELCYPKLEEHPSELIQELLMNGISYILKLKKNFSPQTALQESETASVHGSPHDREAGERSVATRHGEELERADILSQSDVNGEGAVREHLLDKESVGPITEEGQRKEPSVSDDDYATDTDKPTTTSAPSRLGKKKLRQEARRRKAEEPATTPLEDALTGISNHKRFTRRSLRGLLNHLMREGAEVTGRKVKFAHSFGTPSLEGMMNGFHPIHGTRERPMTELKGLAATVRKKQTSQKDKS